MSDIQTKDVCFKTFLFITSFPKLGTEFLFRLLETFKTSEEFVFLMESETITNLD